MFKILKAYQIDSRSQPLFHERSTTTLFSPIWHNYFIRRLVVHENATITTGMQLQLINFLWFDPGKGWSDSLYDQLRLPKIL